MRVDPKLARGLTMAEARAILRHDHAAAPGSLRDEGHPVRRAAKPVLWRYRTGRPPDRTFVLRLAEAIDAAYADDPGTVSRAAREVPGYRPEEGAPWFERRYLHLRPASSEEGCRALRASCTAVTVDDIHVSLNQVELFEVHLHVIDRFHERTRSGLVRDAMRTFGTELLARIGLFWGLTEASHADLDGAFAVPFADGLALAALVPRPFMEVEPFAFVQPIGREPLFYDKAENRVAARKATPVSRGARIATFVGPCEMNERQRRYREAVEAIAARHAEHIAHVTDMMTATGRVLKRMMEPDFEAWSHRNSLTFRRDMTRLLEDPEMVRAMGATRQ